ncbi:MAG TPA: class I SAM-dependent methyltransferase [Steroidobacteraceae bacterium]|nr:class I SAM-dependent methyltransferase [Steroidobacteraceae bacterium]
MQSKERFDAAYYRRFYTRASTRAMSKPETERRAALIAALVAQLEIPVKRILDVGCGLGWFRKPLLKVFPRARYEGVEYSQYLCGKLGWHHGSVVDFKGRGQYDLVICCDVIQYLSHRDAERALNNLARLCRGALFIHVPTRHDWQHLMDPGGTDTRVHVRSAQWYRRRLNEYFTHVGNGVLVKYGVPYLQWELAEPWQ